MNSEMQAKLDEVLNRKAELEFAAQAEEQKRKEVAQIKEAERDAIRRRWTESIREINGAITTINAQLANANLKLSIEENRRETTHPGIAQLIIMLTEPDQRKERKLVFNVSALGLVQPVVLIPHSGPKIADFNIEKANQPKYEAVLVEFLDHCYTIR